MPAEASDRPEPAEALLAEMPVTVVSVDAHGRVSSVRGPHDGPLAAADAGDPADALRGVPGLRDALARARGGEANCVTLDVGERLYRAYCWPAREGAIALLVGLPPSCRTEVLDDRVRRAVFDHVPVALHAYDAEGRLVGWNPASERLLGWRAEEVLGAPFAGIPAEDVATFEAAFRGRAAPVADMTIRRRDGTSVIIRRAMAPMPDPRGERGVVVVFDDVTARRMSEDAHARLAAVVEASRDGVVTLDPAGGVTSWNRAAERILGRLERDALGRPFRTLVDTDEGALLDDILARAAAGEVVDGEDLPLRDGGLACLYLTPIRRMGSAGGGVAVVARDVSTERCQQRDLARAAAQSAVLAHVSKAFLAAPLDPRAAYETIARALGEHVGDGCVLRLLAREECSLVTVAAHHRDPSGLALLVDATAAPLPVRGTFQGEVYVTGRAAVRTDAKAPELREQLGDAFVDYLARRGVHSAVIVPIPAEGRILGTLSLFREGSSPRPTPEEVALLEECGRRAGEALERARAYEGARTARRRAEHARARLAGLKARLELAVEARTTQLSSLLEDVEMMSYAMSHELQQGMRHVDANAALVLEDLGDALPADGKRRLQRVRAAARKMSGLVDRLVDVARLAHPELRAEPVDLSALVAEVADELKALSPERDVSVAIEPGVVATGDRPLLRVVLEQLLENAWKFTEPHGKGRVAFGAEPHDGGRAYFVRDDGIGFDMAYAGQLFSPLRQLNPPSSFEGSGLGLATARHALRRMGGRIWAEGRPGEGATFRFTLGEAPAGAPPDAAERRRTVDRTR